MVVVDHWPILVVSLPRHQVEVRGPSRQPNPAISGGNPCSYWMHRCLFVAAVFFWIDLSFFYSMVAVCSQTGASLDETRFEAASLKEFFPEAFLNLCLDYVLTLNKSGNPSIWMVCFSPNQSYHS